MGCKISQSQAVVPGNWPEVIAGFYAPFLHWLAVRLTTDNLAVRCRLWNDVCLFYLLEHVHCSCSSIAVCVLCAFQSFVCTHRSINRPFRASLLTTLNGILLQFAIDILAIILQTIVLRSTNTNKQLLNPVAAAATGRNLDAFGVFAVVRTKWTLRRLMRE